MKSFFILTLISTSLIADDIFLECKDSKELPNADDYTLVLDMKNKTADISTAKEYSGKIDLILHPKYIIIDGYIYNWVGSQKLVSFSIDRKTLEMGMADAPSYPAFFVPLGQCSKIEEENNILWTKIQVK